MAWFKKKADPISQRSRTLNAEIAALEAKIKRYETQLENPSNGSSSRSPDALRNAGAERPALSTKPTAPVFEKVDTRPLTKPVETKTTPEHFNEFGVRKYDLPALFQRLREIFHGPTTSNPRLVNYLAAGGIQGMRPLRREKRIARNRTIALAILLLLALLGMFAVFRPGH
jgi:hypothetical protein